jgi:glutamate-1-semialdehyde 2,1-aminomutase
VAGEGIEIIDEFGLRVIDLGANFTALVHGHAHPRIVTAAQAAIAEGTSF